MQTGGREMLFITDHARQRMAERDITEREARRAVARGRVVSNRAGALRVSLHGVVVVLSLTPCGREAHIITLWRD